MLTGFMGWRMLILPSVFHQVRTDIITIYFPSITSSGSQINFVWETNHNVVLMENKEDFDACTNFSDTEPYEGPLLWDAPSEEGVTYIICGVKTHCADGNQKLAVTVSMDC